ncbi:sigma-54-dependent Fis family transcriptional regulator [Candidatus Babeliales bacterium]|nr:sigma-54-dependent Fis family transcriptional regulator [Candidatus Babeliales bacterium]
MNSSPLLLIVDDETTILKTLKEALEDENYRVATLSDGQKTIDLIGKLIPDLVLLDIFMPNCNGIELMQKIKKEYPNQKIIIISGFGNIPIAIKAIKKGAIDFIEKPLNLDEILSKIKFIQKFDQQKNFHTQKQKKIESLQNYGIIGQSYLFLELIQQIKHISKLQLPLLIYGQHGTGKTLISKYIHQINDFPKNQFSIINCSTLNYSEEIKLIEKEFLEKKTGTIFIKNIDQLSTNGQKKLLSKLEKYNKEKIKVIISSCVSLFNLLKSKNFNANLFHKLNTTPIEIPTLNKRRYDIPLLVDYYLKKANQKYKKSLQFTSKSIRTLRNITWQENITELIAFIEKVVSSCLFKDIVITTQDLNHHLSQKNTLFIEEQSFLYFNSLQEATSEFEKKFLIYSLKKNRYDLEQVCDQLNLTTVQLRDKMLKFNIEFKI